MFTGLVQEIGTIAQVRRSVGSLHWSIRAPRCSRELRAGDSVNVAGACQTVETVSGDIFTGTAIPETLAKTTYSEWTPGGGVNLELALHSGDRLGGHMVSGHVDTVGSVVRMSRDSDGIKLTFSFDKRFDSWTLPQGSIALDGVSLTIAARNPGSVTVALIPETLQRTTLGKLEPGGRINIEFDQFVKAVVQHAAGEPGQPGQKSRIDANFLAKAGWR